MARVMTITKSKKMVPIIMADLLKVFVIELTLPRRRKEGIPVVVASTPAKVPAFQCGNQYDSQQSSDHHQAATVHAASSSSRAGCSESPRSTIASRRVDIGGRKVRQFLASGAGRIRRKYAAHFIVQLQAHLAKTQDLARHQSRMEGLKVRLANAFDGRLQCQPEPRHIAGKVPRIKAMLAEEVANARVQSQPNGFLCKL